MNCEREEKRSQDRWRKKETWQLDYVRKYVNSIVKENKQQKQKINAWNKAEKIQKAPNRKIYGFETVKQTTRNSNVRNTQQTKMSQPKKQQTRYVSPSYYRNKKQKIRNERELTKCNTHSCIQ